MTLKKAFLFDMDGVLLDSESAWINAGYDQLLINYFGREIWEKRLKNCHGEAIKTLFNFAVEEGFSGKYEEFLELNNQMALTIYATTPITQNLDILITYLIKREFILGIVSSSPFDWVEQFVPRLPQKDAFSYILSVNNHPTLKPKPSPDPYIKAMNDLNVLPENTLILEDSNSGVKAGIASGATVICLTEHTKQENVPLGADYYASDMLDVMKITMLRN